MGTVSQCTPTKRSIILIKGVIVHVSSLLEDYSVHCLLSFLVLFVVVGFVCLFVLFLVFFCLVGLFLFYFFPNFKLVFFSLSYYQGSSFFLFLNLSLTFPILSQC